MSCHVLASMSLVTPTTTPGIEPDHSRTKEIPRPPTLGRSRVWDGHSRASPLCPSRCESSRVADEAVELGVRWTGTGRWRSRRSPIPPRLTRRPRRTLAIHLDDQTEYPPTTPLVVHLEPSTTPALADPGSRRDTLLTPASGREAGAIRRNPGAISSQEPRIIRTCQRREFRPPRRGIRVVMLTPCRVRTAGRASEPSRWRFHEVGQGILARRLSVTTISTSWE